MNSDAKSKYSIDVLKAFSESDGYMDLSMWRQAEEILNSLPPDIRNSAEGLFLRYRLYASQELWSRAAETARQLKDRQPQLPEVWIMLAYAARRAANVDTARSILLQALKQFPAVPTIPYNLACYECVSNNLAQAENYLQAACKLNPKLRALARKDEDLRPLWKKIKLSRKSMAD